MLKRQGQFDRSLMKHRSVEDDRVVDGKPEFLERVAVTGLGTARDAHYKLHHVLASGLQSILSLTVRPEARRGQNPWTD